MPSIKTFLRSPSKSVALRAMGKSLHPRPSRERSLEQHLDATYSWLCAAHDAAADGGVASTFHLGSGWHASYPETTGYIIPNMLAMHALRGDSAARRRALRMADWEIEVQLPSGAVQGGLIGTPAEPAVFDTGQVLFGWVSALGATGEPRYSEAARRAASWLISVQDPDGAWRRDLSLQTSNAVHVYNVRAAWGLALAGISLDEPAWVSAAQANARWVLTQQDASGWFANAEFHPGETPLLHTIAYTIEGLLAVGRLTSDSAIIGGALRSLNGLLARRRRDGGFFGRYDSGWNPTVSWRCPVGEAQVAVVMLRQSLLGENSASESAEAGLILDEVCALQDMRPASGPAYGGVPGSYPIWGPYVRWSYLNWGAKFLMDALLLKLHGKDPHEPVAPTDLRTLRGAPAP